MPRHKDTESGAAIVSRFLIDGLPDLPSKTNTRKTELYAELKRHRRIMQTVRRAMLGGIVSQLLAGYHDELITPEHLREIADQLEDEQEL